VLKSLSDFAEKAHSIATPRRWGQSNTKYKQNDDNGKYAGKEVEHWDDHQDAYPRPRTIRLKMFNQEED
jgi:hypothetical protein